MSPRTADLLLGLGEEVMILVSAHGGRLANDVGYESEPSFNRAFKREFGVQPARFRILHGCSTSFHTSISVTATGGQNEFFRSLLEPRR
jgi:AraC-like DNA-binding protein